MDAMDERATECPQCQNSTAVYKHLEFHITPCGHSLCFDCADRHLPRLGSAIPCKTKLSDTTHCGFTITKNGLIPENGSDPFISKEMAKRRKVLETLLIGFQTLKRRSYNATEEDFPTLAEYYQYQEEIEEIIYNLLGSDGAEITKTTARIKAYYDAHQDEIRMRADRKAAREAELDRQLLEAAQAETVDEMEVDAPAEAMETTVNSMMETSKPQRPNMVAQFQAPTLVNVPAKPGPEKDARPQGALRKLTFPELAAATGYSHQFVSKRAIDEAFHGIPSDLRLHLAKKGFRTTATS